MSSNRTFLQSVKVPVVLILFLSIIGTVGVGCQENNGVNQIETVIGVPVTNEPVESIDLIATELPTVTAVPEWNVTSVASVTLPTTPNTLIIPSATPITPTPFVAVTAARPNYYIEDTTNYMVL